jgi:hypothetical protein
MAWSEGRRPPVTPGRYHPGETLVSMPAMTNELVSISPGGELQVGLGYPNTAERIVRSMLHIMGIITLTLVSAILLFLIISGWRVADTVGDLTPIPAVTTCPPGDKECGR